MAKRTLLELTQNILGAMSSDQVSGITDTDESTQVAEILRETYEELMSQRDWTHLNKLVSLTGLGNTSFPTAMGLPSNVDNLIWFKYDNKVDNADPSTFQEVIYKDPETFLDIIQSRTTDATNTTAYADPVSGIVFNINTDNPPQYWTSFDDENIICDSFDSAVDNTLQSSKTSAYAVTETTWIESDDYIPDMPSKMFPLLLAEAKSVALLNLKQIASNKEEVRSRRQNNTMQHRSQRQNGREGYTAYGRTTRPTRNNSTR